VSPFRFRLFVVAAVLVMAAPGLAETRRIAVVVGNNVGSGARPALRYAEEDATKMAQVLSDLGGIAPADLFLLRGSSLSTVEDTLQTVLGRVASSRQSGQTLVLFYFSGHSDGQSLELGQDHLSFSDLRHWLQNTGADVRLAFVDSCRSGGLLALKGGTPGPFFDIHVNDNMESTGEVLITSSAADESALESTELKGSFFSHHLMSGLRGAADVSGDGAVTLSEAYQYAFARTLSATTNTVIGPQHPNYDYRLSGRGEVVLTRIRTPAAILELPSGFERILVSDADHDRVIGEIGPQGNRRFAVRPGRYEIRAWHHHSLHGVELRVSAGETATVQASSLQPWQGVRNQAKGDVELASDRGESGYLRSGDWSMGLMLGTTRSVAHDLGFLPGLIPSLRVSVAREKRAWVASLSVDLAAFQDQEKRESQVQIAAGLGREFHHRRWGCLLGAELDGGTGVQRSQSGEVRSSGLFSAAAVVEGSWSVSDHWLAALMVRAPATLVRVEKHETIQFMPAAWAGALYAW
jgi:hypothetical protein